MKTAHASQSGDGDALGPEGLLFRLSDPTDVAAEGGRVIEYGHHCLLGRRAGPRSSNVLFTPQALRDTLFILF
jgi:hypothetical protein